MENAGISIPSDEKKSRAKSGKSEKKVYRDSDDDGWDSRDEDFIATSDESEGEDISSSVQNKIRKYVEKSGISLTRDADRAPPTKGAPREVALFTPAPAPAPDTSLSDHFMDKTAWYKELLDRAESPPPIATQADVFFSVGQRKPAKPPAKSKPAAGSAKSKPAAGSAKSKPRSAPATARVKETDLSSRKVASIFKPGGGKAKAAAPAVETGIHWDRKEGKAYHVDKSGKRTPCEI